jgi:hypothetical protein
VTPYLNKIFNWSGSNILQSQNEAIEIRVYNPELKGLWDAFVSSAKNGVFLFNRDYMGYHSDRFQDHSLLFFRDNRLVALLPANIDNETLYSHAGLTFGGVISGYDMNTSLMLDIFNSLIHHCRNQGITDVVYKAIPHIYHSIPADEDLYALFCLEANLFARNITSSIYRPSMQSLKECRIRAIKKAEKNNLIVKRSYDFKTFMQIVQEVLKERHGVNPVHTAQEIEFLANRFPNNIQLFSAYINEKMLAGVLIYENKNVAHSQYSVNSTEGLQIGALDLILKYLIYDFYKTIKYFDFGISTEQNGLSLNVGLLRYKESFGANAVMHDIYKFTVGNLNNKCKKVEAK